jgi:hypothetical protein
VHQSGSSIQPAAVSEQHQIFSGAVVLTPARQRQPVSIRQNLLISRSLNRFRRVTALMSLPARTAFNAFLCPSVTLNRLVIPRLAQ